MLESYTYIQCLYSVGGTLVTHTHTMIIVKEERTMYDKRNYIYY